MVGRRIARLAALAVQAETEMPAQHKAPTEAQGAAGAGPLHAAVRRQDGVGPRQVQPITQLSGEASRLRPAVLRGQPRRGLALPQRLGAAVHHAPARVQPQGETATEPARVQAERAA